MVCVQSFSHCTMQAVTPTRLMSGPTGACECIWSNGPHKWNPIYHVAGVFCLHIVRTGSMPVSLEPVSLVATPLAIHEHLARRTCGDCAHDIQVLADTITVELQPMMRMGYARCRLSTI